MPEISVDELVDVLAESGEVDPDMAFRKVCSRRPDKGMTCCSADLLAAVKNGVATGRIAVRYDAKTRTNFLSTPNG